MLNYCLISKNCFHSSFPSELSAVTGVNLPVSSNSVFWRSYLSLSLTALSSYIFLYSSVRALHSPLITLVCSHMPISGFSFLILPLWSAKYKKYADIPRFGAPDSALAYLRQPLTPFRTLSFSFMSS